MLFVDFFLFLAAFCSFELSCSGKYSRGSNAEH